MSSLNTSILAAKLAAAIVAASFAAMADFNASDTSLRLYWKFDGKGNRPVATDVSGHSRDGASSNTVCGCVNSNIKAFNGFTANTSYVCCTNALGGTWEYQWTFVAWVRNPDWSSTAPHMIARGCRNGSTFGKNSDNAWSLWIDTQGRVRVGLQIGGRGYTNDVNAVRTVEWKRDTWYQVALVFGQLNNPHRDETKVYVTEAGAESIGDPVVDWTYETASYLFGCTALTVGAAEQGYYSVAHPGGCFKGDIRDVSVWGKRLSTADLLGDVQSFNESWHELDEVALLHWRFDETGELPSAVDSTTNGLAGTSFGNVEGRVGSHTNFYSGFTSMGSYVGAALPIPFTSESDMTLKKFDVLMWVRNPRIATGEKAVLACGSLNDKYGNNETIPWEVWLNDDGSVEAGIWDWGGTTYTAASEPLAWEPGRWYQVLIRHDYLAVANDRFSVWVTPAGEDSTLGEPVVSVTSERCMAGSGATSYGRFSVGGGYNGWYSKLPGGYWGGQIADVVFSRPQLEARYLEARLKAWCFPADGLIISFR